MALISMRRFFDHAAEHGYDVPVEEIQLGIKHGVRKINIDTDIRLAVTGAIRRAFNDDKSEFDPRKYLKPATLAAQSICKARFEAFGTAGNAEKIKPIPLEAMAERYAKMPHWQKPPERA